MSARRRASAEGDADLAAAASVLADPSRADMISALADGRALPAGELARAAGVSASTASSHLARMLDFGLVEVERHGRHRYYHLASPNVVALTEMLAQLAPRKPVRSLRGARVAAALAQARTCYDHLAGDLGVAVFEALQTQELLHVKAGEVTVPDDTTGALDDLQIDVAAFRRDPRRPLARLCLDWSARRHHLAGALGAAITGRMIELHWIQRTDDSRALSITDHGWEGLHRHFNIQPDLATSARVTTAV